MSLILKTNWGVDESEVVTKFQQKDIGRTVLVLRNVFGQTIDECVLSCITFSCNQDTLSLVVHYFFESLENLV